MTNRNYYIFNPRVLSSTPCAGNKHLTSGAKNVSCCDIGQQRAGVTQMVELLICKNRLTPSHTSIIPQQLNQLVIDNEIYQSDIRGKL